MLTVAPKGSIKLLNFLGTLAPFSVHSMVNGRVAELLEVEKAVSRAGVSAFKRRSGERLAISFTANGRAIKAWINSASNTVQKNQSKGDNRSEEHTTELQS